MDRRGDDVVGMDGISGAEFAAEDLYGPVGDDLVGVHVRGGPGARLEDVEDELVVEFALHYLLGGPYDGVPELLVEEAELEIHVRGLELDRAEGLHEAARLAQVAYREVVEGTPRLGAEEGVARDLDLPHRVVLYPVRGLVLGHGSSRRSSDVQVILCSKRSS